MVDELRHAFEQAQHQPEAVQRDLAQHITAWLNEAAEEREWDALIGSPQGQTILERLAAEARAEIARGNVEDGGWEE
jgi:hypothetical protein